MRTALVVFILWSAQGGFANAASDLSAGGPRYSIVTVPSDPKSVWLVDTFTGSLSRCEFQDLKTIPICSPWAATPGEQAMYRYDPETKQIVPMNEAARQKEHKKNSN